MDRDFANLYTTGPTFTDLDPASPINYGLGGSPCSELSNEEQSMYDLYGWKPEIDSDWRQTYPTEWNSSQTIAWVMNLQGKSDDWKWLEPSYYSHYNGSQLCSLTREEFNRLDPAFGTRVYNELCNALTTRNDSLKANDESYGEQLNSITQMLQQYSVDVSETHPSLKLPEFSEAFGYFPAQIDSGIDSPSQSSTIICQTAPCSPTPSQVSSVSSAESVSVPVKPKRSRRGKGKGKLWEFMLNLLLNSETNPSIIQWEDRSTGVFKIIKSEKVAELWGVRKGNKSMNYEKLSRALRYYYNRNILERIEGRRLFYKFGSASKGWQLQ